MSKIIASVDGSRSSPSVCDHAVWAARRLQAPLTFLHAYRNPHGEREADLSGNLTFGVRENLLDEMVQLEEQRGRLAREQARAILEDAMSRAREQGIENPGRLLRNGEVTDVLDKAQEEMRLLVLGKQGEDGDAVEQHIGSHLESTIRRVQKPILVAPLAFREPERFLIAYDGSPAAQRVVDRITESPLLQGLEAHLLLVDADTAVNRERLLAPRQQLEAAGLTVHAEVRPGGIDDTVCNYRKEQDIHLMAMGAYGHSRLRRFFVGSTTTHMIMRSSTPLLILR
ncbi:MULTISPECIES: universal stress protein [unclassified Halorhodospira]|uniref:universal stress protein n=1 Tax=unclassified Halorhodospira TaxID=2626748 RepID=UPI001EE918B4|nr:MULTISPECIES: universal stress protein [unclassified Halorhodospira]MCG5539950.1 universal stress protein [Halorhodospira sp. M39old]MCG5545214.1 universal stress protein [Halorhodospira sp. M38]